jgi:hypothetical protein
MMAPYMMPNHMSSQYMTPVMMMPAPASMTMMQQQKIKAHPQQMMAPMVQVVFHDTAVKVGPTEHTAVGQTSTVLCWIRNGITHGE